MTAIEREKKPTLQNNFKEIHDWFVSQPNYNSTHHWREIPVSQDGTRPCLVYGSLYTAPDNLFNENRGVVGKEICSVSLYEHTRILAGTLFHIGIILDENKESAGLTDGFFYSWVHIGDREYLLTYSQEHGEQANCARLTKVQERAAQKKGDRGKVRATKDVGLEEQRMVLDELVEKGYPLVVDYVATVKRVMLSLSSEELIADPYVGVEEGL